MGNITLPIELFAVDTVAELGRTFIDQCLPVHEEISRVWVVLSHPQTQETICANGDSTGYRIAPKSERLAPIPPEIQSWLLLAPMEPQIKTDHSGVCFAIVPLVHNAVHQGYVILQGGVSALQETLLSLVEIAPILAFLSCSLSQKALFRELERSKQQWEAALDSIQDLLFVCDNSGKLRKVNRALAERLGTTPREVMAQPERFFAYFDELLKHPPHSHEWHCSPLQLTFDVHCADVYDQAHNRAGYVYILRDITDRIRLERQMRQGEKLAALGEMVSGIAHELNNPLTSIVGYAEMLVQSGMPTSEIVRNKVRKIGMEADRAALIVQNMLAFVRPPSSNQVPLCLNEIIHQVADLRSDLLATHSIGVTLSLDPNLPLIKGCPHELQQVLLNLVDNAIHALNGSQKCGHITIQSTILNAQRLLLAVKDNGPGILPEHKEKLLLPFFTTKRVGEGSGLGLSISYGILRSHGATLNVHSEFGAGAEFVMEFPIFSPSLYQLPESSSPQKENKPRLSSPSKLHETARLAIAVLDDEPILLDLLTEMLSDSGHHVTTFSSPSLAFTALHKQHFDVILCDVRMPEMSGMEFYEQIRKQHPEYLSKIMFLTGDVLAPETRRFIEKNHCPCLNKPFKAEVLRGKIEEIVGNGSVRVRKAAA